MKKDRENQVLSSVDLVNEIVNEYNLESIIISKEDLFQQAFIGLINAVDTYDKNIKESFRDYASAYIKFSINEILGKKVKTNSNNKKIYQKNAIKVKSLNPYFRRMDIKTVNILRMYFGLDNEEVDINYIAFINCVPTSEINSIIREGLNELKYLIEDDYKRTLGPSHRKDDNIYIYYSEFNESDVDRATILLTDRQKELQELRFNKEKVNTEIRSKYSTSVRPRMLYYLEKLVSFGNLKDAYMEMMLEKRAKAKKKTM